MKLTWRQIEAFRAIMLTGSITQAAEYLFISQPAVSTILSNFEQEVGYKLFKRQHGRLVATSEAEALLPEIERAFVGLEDIKLAAKAIGQMKTGILRVVIMPALAGRVFTDIIANFLTLHENIFLNIEIQPLHIVLDWISRNHCDLGLIGQPYDLPDVESQLLSTDKAVCVLHPDHQLTDKKFLTAQDLNGENLICPSSGAHVRRQLDRILEEKQSYPNRRVEIRTNSALCQLVERDIGIGIMTNFKLSGQNQNQNVVVKPFMPEIWTDVLLLNSKHKPMSKLAKAFCKHLTKEYKKHL